MTSVALPSPDTPISHRRRRTGTLNGLRPLWAIESVSELDSITDPAGNTGGCYYKGRDAAAGEWAHSLLAQ